MKRKQEAYKAGYDAGRNGPNIDNCNFRFFATKKLKDEWEQGNRHGKAHAEDKEEPNGQTK